MSVLTGVLLDVSGSMEESVGDGVKEEGGSWARSIFKVVDDLIKNDVSESNHVFAIGVGGSGEPGVFDMLNTLKSARPSSTPACSGRSKWDILDEALAILEREGAPRVRWWAKMDVLLDVVGYEQAVLILDKLQHDSDFTSRFVRDCLPDECKGFELQNIRTEAGFFALGVANFLLRVPVQQDATKGSVREAVRKGMALITEGALVRVSTADAVMEAQQGLEILRGHVGQQEARSIFKVVDDLIKNDVSESNHVFAIGVGGSGEPGVFDMLNTLKSARPSSTPACSGRSKRHILDEALAILERAGAPKVRRWAKMDVLLDVVGYEQAVLILDKLQHDSDFTSRFVRDCLPDECKGFRLQNIGTEAGFVALGVLYGEPAQKYATKDSVREAVRKGMALIKEGALVRVSTAAAVMEAQQALEILRGHVGEQELTNDRVDKLMEDVRPFIFGDTPLIEALGRARDLFSLRRYSDHHKLLFVLSDGQPTDGDRPPLTALARLGVIIVSCFITHRSIAEPLRLYSTERREWEAAAKFMFGMSSTVATQQIPRTIFVKRGWQIDTENNETRLFCQVNHPKIISDVCDLARNVVCCQDALSDILATVSLDIYINEANQGFGAKEQVGGTCYANASAAVLHLAMSRVVGRDGGYPDFFSIRADLIKRYGDDGAYISKVLKEVCPRYRLQCSEVDVDGALKAVTAKRPVIAIFSLTDNEWASFSKFYKKKKTGDFDERHKKGILTSSEIDIGRRPLDAKLSGHAVVLTSYDSQGLRLMNSWGSEWADGGFFRVQNASVLRLEFVDVFWTLDDLRQSEKDAYAREGPKIAAKLMSSLKGLQSAEYTCPLCRVRSKVECFSGHLLQATCPQCNGTFVPKDGGDDLALNLYLTSLCG